MIQYFYKNFDDQSVPCIFLTTFKQRKEELHLFSDETWQAWEAWPTQSVTIIMIKSLQNHATYTAA